MSGKSSFVPEYTRCLTSCFIPRDVKLLKAHIPSTIIQPLISPKNLSLQSATVRPNGAPVLLVSDGVAYSYDAAMSVWVKVDEARWAHGSDAWDGKQRSAPNRASSAKGIFSSIELAIVDMDLRNQPSPIGFHPDSATQLPQWWNEALTLGHLETKILGSKLLDSPQEFKMHLQQYATKLAAEGFRAKAEELLRELCGPLYWYAVLLKFSTVQY